MPRYVRWIWLLLAIHLAIGMIAYVHFLITGTYDLLSLYFLFLGSFFFLVMTAAECILAFVCRSWFDSDEPMRLAWTMIGCASMARFAGTLLREASSRQLPWGLGHWLIPHAGGLFSNSGQLGLLIGGPVSMAFLAIGLARVLGIQRKFHLVGSLTRGDQALLFLILAFSISQIAINLPLLARHPSLGTILLWLSDPLLSLLLIEAVLVRRSVVRIGQGLLAHCWGMYVIAVVTTSLGDATIWATSHNLLPEPLTVLSWYIWFIAAAAFASAPAYQLAAMSLTREGILHLPENR
jgi:hypothetical protein